MIPHLEDWQCLAFGFGLFLATLSVGFLRDKGIKKKYFRIPFAASGSAMVAYLCTLIDESQAEFALWEWAVVWSVIILLLYTAAFGKFGAEE